MKTSLFLLSCLLLVTGCEMMVPPWHVMALRQEAKRPVTCIAGQDCKDKWDRALQWVKTNSTYPIVTQTATQIKTGDSVSLSPAPAFTVNIIPAGDNNFAITLDADCDDSFGCIPPLLKLRADFTRYVMEPATPLKKVE